MNKQKLILGGLAALMASVGFIDAILLWYASKNMFPSATCQLDERLAEYRPVGIQNDGLNLILVLFGALTLGVVVLNGVIVFRFFFSEEELPSSAIDAVRSAGFLNSSPPHPGDSQNWLDPSQWLGTAIAPSSNNFGQEVGEVQRNGLQPPKTLEELHRAITSPPFDWIGKCFRNPILIYGEQGCGKTSIAEGIAASRILLFGDTVSVCDLHAHKNRWERLFPVVRGHWTDFASYEREIERFLARVNGTNSPAHTSIWDELTRLAQNTTGNAMRDFLPAVLADCRKANEHPILLAHDRTLKALGGAEGFSKARDRGLIEIRRTAIQDSFGKPTPNPVAYISGIDRDDKGHPIEREILVPNWFHGDYLLALGQSVGLDIPFKSVGNQTVPNIPSQSPMPEENNNEKQPGLVSFSASSARSEPAHALTYSGNSQPLPSLSSFPTEDTTTTDTTTTVLEAKEYPASEVQELLQITDEPFSNLLKAAGSPDHPIVIDQEITLSVDKRRDAIAGCEWFQELPESIKETLFVTVLWDRRRGVSKSDTIKRHLLKKCDYTTGKAIYESLFSSFHSRYL